MNRLLQLGWSLRRRLFGALRLRTRGVKVMLFNGRGELLLIRNGRDLIFYIARARTPMPKSTREYIERCEVFLATGRTQLPPPPLPA